MFIVLYKKFRANVLPFSVTIPLGLVYNFSDWPQWTLITLIVVWVFSLAMMVVDFTRIFLRAFDIYELRIIIEATTIIISMCLTLIVIGLFMPILKYNSAITSVVRILSIFTIHLLVVFIHRKIPEDAFTLRFYSGEKTHNNS